MNPFELASEISALNDIEVQRDADLPKSVSLIENAVWGDEDDVNMNLPVDGWNSRHWRRYFGMQYKLIFGHIYTGVLHSDRIALSKFIFKSRMELQMNNSEMKEYIDWVANNRMKYVHSIGGNFFLGNLLDHLPEYYNHYIHNKQVSDLKERIPSRDLIIDNTDLRLEIAKYIIKDEHSRITYVDSRLYVQFGIPIMIQYFMVQEHMTNDGAMKFIIEDMKKIIKEDVAYFGQMGGSKAPRFERIVKSSIAWEPYPWVVTDWRNGSLRSLIKYFKIDECDWWRDNQPIGIKPAGCLRMLKCRKTKKKGK